MSFFETYIHVQIERVILVAASQYQLSAGGIRRFGNEGPAVQLTPQREKQACVLFLALSRAL